MKAPYEICYAAKEDSSQIAKYMEQFDTIIVFMPLYVHAMPGIVMKIFEYMESAQSKYLERYLSALTKNLNYTYLGTVIRGGSAGTYMMPEQMSKKLFKQLNALGEYFERNGIFNIETVKEMSFRIFICRSDIFIAGTTRRQQMPERRGVDPYDRIQ